MLNIHINFRILKKIKILFEFTYVFSKLENNIKK